MLTKVKGGKLVIDKVDGKYFMYWGEYAVHAATSDNLTDWYPVLDENNELLKIARPRNGYFDSQMTECGPPAIRTKQGIVLMYNGKNDKREAMQIIRQVLTALVSSCLIPKILIKYWAV